MKPDQLLTYFGKVQIPSIKAEQDGERHPQFSLNTRYINNTRKVIQAKLRSGMEISIPAAPVRPNNYDGQVIVQHELVVGASCVNAMKDYFISIPKDVTGSLMLFRDEYLRMFQDFYQIGRPRELRCVIEHYFHETELSNMNGLFYHDELDTLFKLGVGPFLVPHPHSYEGRKLAAREPAEDIKQKNGFVFWVEIIDNLGKYGDRYLSICNSVYKIVARTDKNRPDGLYIVSSKPTNGKINPSEISERFYSFEDIEKELGVYPSYELAASNGDVAASRKREFQAREHEIQLERQNFQREKMRLDAELEEKNRQVKVMEHERSTHVSAMEELRKHQEHLMEMQRLQMKDQYERRSTERKDSSEMIKFLPAILAGVGTILMAWKAFRSSSGFA